MDGFGTLTPETPGPAVDGRPSRAC